MTNLQDRLLTITSIFARSIELVRGRLIALALFSFAFKAIHLALLAPLATWTLRIFLERWGRASVGNFEIASFLLSPVGLIAMCCVGGITAATLYLEIACLMEIMLKPSFKWSNNFQQFVQLFQRLVRLGATQLAVVLTIALPFLGVIYVIYATLWRDRDLNGLIILKPAEFWWGAGLSAGVLTLLGALILALYLRWILAVPILLRQSDCAPRQALSSSRQHTRLHMRLIVKCLLVWLVIQLGTAFCFGTIMRFGLLELLNYPWQSLSTAALATGLALGIEWIVGALLSIFSNIGLAATVLALYEAIVGTADINQRSHSINEPAFQEETRETSRMLVLRWWILGSSLALIVGSVVITYWICDTLKLKDTISLTAHRAGAALGPENTIAALRRAIADQAPWAEIDVQLTADEELVVMHDTDLARVGGGSVPVAKSTLEQIQMLDVGRLFSADYQGEQIPRFSDFLAAAKGKIRLNVELKPHGAADTRLLAHKVVDAIRQADMIDQCRICSQSYEGIQLARSIEPRLEIGFIAATALGDMTKLNVDFLMLSHSEITPALVERAQARGVKIHAWTVNDPKLVLKLVDAGVSNIITDDVVRIAQQLKTIEALHPMERLLLRAKNGLSANSALPESTATRAHGAPAASSSLKPPSISPTALQIRRI